MNEKYILSVGNQYDIEITYSGEYDYVAYDNFLSTLQNWDAIDNDSIIGGGYPDPSVNEFYLFLSFNVVKASADMTLKLSDDVILTFSAVETTSKDMYRLYNPNSGEHFYTADANERTNLTDAGWSYEGIEWTAPAKSNTPVYRLYSGTDHHYTMDASERDNLIKAGWKYEGIGWYSDDNKTVPLYRQYNPYVDPNAKTNNSGSHNYTTDKSENDH